MGEAACSRIKSYTALASHLKAELDVGIMHSV